MRTRGSLIAAALVAGSAASVLTAGPASAGNPLARDVVLATHTVRGGSTAKHDDTAYPAVVRISNVSTAAARAMGSVITQQAHSLASPTEASTSVQVSAIVAEADNRYVSVVLVTDTYAYGAAHPETLLDTLVFDRSTGKQLGWKDFFKDPAKAVPVLRSEVKRNAKYALGPAYDASFVAEGVSDVAADAAPDFVPRPWGMEFFFSQGEIGPEALGPATVLVPWKALRPLLKLPLPDLGGGAKAPAYTGGQALLEPSLIKSLTAKVAASKLQGLAGRRTSSYRLLDARVVYAQVDADDVEALYVTTLVPFATPGKPLSILFALGGDESDPHLDIVDVERGAVGCGTVSSAFIKALRETCR